MKFVVGVLDMVSNVSEGICNIIIVFDGLEFDRICYLCFIFNDGIVWLYN